MVDELISSLDVVPIQPAPVLHALDVTSAQEEFDILKGLLYSSDWPEAVFELQIADENSESDKEERASGIAEILLPPLNDKRFLDFGCGEGHVAKYVSECASVSIGYDITRKGSLSWEEEGKFLLTVDLEKVKSMAPYDIILVYDVLDHAEKPSEILATAKTLLSDDGMIYVRCHPWCCRHGGHAYRSINKAFVHLVFDDEEMKKLGLNFETATKTTSPLKMYETVIRAAGLEPPEPEIERQEVEGFFHERDEVRRRILARFGISEWQEERPAFQMSQCFVDYKLKK